jgi:hypothetical protein
MGMVRSSSSPCGLTASDGFVMVVSPLGRYVHSQPFFYKGFFVFRKRTTTRENMVVAKTIRDYNGHPLQS